MITAVVTFKLPPEMSREKWQENIKQVSTRFQNVPGLIRKQFLYSDKGVGGGVYLWETREAAENCYYKSPWGENVRKVSGGNEPEIAWFETGVVVDNENHQIKTATYILSTTAIVGSPQCSRACPLWANSGHPDRLRPFWE